ncbi:MAG: pilus assembly protein [Candidatus Dadabacteria bacterium]
MVIPDTAIWIDFFRKKPNVFQKMRELLENRAILAVECIFGELLQGCKDKEEIVVIKSYWQNLPKVDQYNSFIEAGETSATEKFLSKGIGLIDAVLIISLRRTKSKIWTLDKKLLSVLSKEEIYSP